MKLVIIVLLFISGCSQQNHTVQHINHMDVALYGLSHQIMCDEPLELERLKVKDQAGNSYSFTMYLDDQEIEESISFDKPDTKVLKFVVNTYPQKTEMFKTLEIIEKTVVNNTVERDDKSESNVEKTSDKPTSQPQVTPVNPPNNKVDYLILVNKEQALSRDFIPLELVESDNGTMLDRTANEHLQALKEAMRQEGLHLHGISGYRSYDYQAQLYNNYVATYSQEEADTFSARPGHSEHQTGLAMDVAKVGASYLDFGQSAESVYVNENAHKFGFIVRYTESNRAITGYVAEPWHLRYVGIEHATRIYNQGVNSLESYLK